MAKGGRVPPPMRSRFAYGISPPGYSQKRSSTGVAPLSPQMTYTVVVDLAMGSPEYFTLEGGSLAKALSYEEYGPKSC
jgi:hypothetical protein